MVPNRPAAPSAQARKLSAGPSGRPTQEALVPLTPKTSTDSPVLAAGMSAMDRRSILKLSGLAIGGLSMSSLLAACGADGAATSGSDSLTLKMPFIQDMQVPDPDIMYEGEGVQVMRACYDGLLL